MAKPRCMAIVPPTTYRGLHPCSKWANLKYRKYRGRMLLLCPHHVTMVEAGKRLAGGE